MRTTHRAPRFVRWGVALAATGLLSLGGVWVHAQDREPRQAPPVADRQQVPSLQQLEATLTRLRRDATPEAGGPALEHAALALGRARGAETDEDAGAASAAEASLHARRIAYAALTLAEAQQTRERARLARDEAARLRHDAEGAERTAREALRVARDNAAASHVAPAVEAGVPPAAPAPAAAQEGAAP